MRQISTILFVVIVFVGGLSSCSKYEDGPSLSLRSKYARMEGVYQLSSVEALPDSLVPSFIHDVQFTIESGGGGDVLFALPDTTVNSNFQWEFNDEMTQFRVRRYYMHKDTVMYSSLDSLYQMCFYNIQPEYSNFQQAMYGNYNTWGEWGEFMTISELSNDALSFDFKNDTLSLDVSVQLSE